MAHLDNIITGLTFSYTFCDARTALRDAVLTVGGVVDHGMTAFQSREKDVNYYMTECVWVRNDANGFKFAKQVGIGLSKEDCLKKVQASLTGVCKGATIAQFRPQDEWNEEREEYVDTCECQTGNDVTSQDYTDKEICLLSSLYTKEQATTASTVTVTDICKVVLTVSVSLAAWWQPRLIFMLIRSDAMFLGLRISKRYLKRKRRATSSQESCDGLIRNGRLLVSKQRRPFWRSRPQPLNL